MLENWLNYDNIDASINVANGVKDIAVEVSQQVEEKINFQEWSWTEEFMKKMFDKMFEIRDSYAFTRIANNNSSETLEIEELKKTNSRLLPLVETWFEMKKTLDNVRAYYHFMKSAWVERSYLYEDEIALLEKKFLIFQGQVDLYNLDSEFIEKNGLPKNTTKEEVWQLESISISRWKIFTPEEYNDLLNEFRNK